MTGTGAGPPVVTEPGTGFRPMGFETASILGMDSLLYLCYYPSMRKNNERTSADVSADRPIYNRIAVLRVERGLSRRDLADALGVNYQTVGYIERGEYSPSLELTFRLSELFGLPIEAIFSRQPFKPLSEELYGSSSPT